MIKVANLVIEAGVCSLHSVFKAAFPSVTYHTMNAKRKLLQMPLVAFQGNKEVFLMELVEGVDYLKVVHFINACMVSNTGSKSMSKLELNKLLLLARTDREKGLVKHTTFRASGLTKSSARAHLGLEDLSERMCRIEECIEEVEAIRQSIECLSQVKEKALMRSLGFSESEESEQSSEDESVDDASMFEEEELESNDASISETFSKPRFLELIQECDYNWFDLIDRVIEENKNCNENEAIKVLDSLYFSLAASFNFSVKDMENLKQSHEAFRLDCDRRIIVDREANAINGQIVSDIESDDPEQYSEIHNLAHSKAKCLVAKKRKLFRRQERYMKSKQLAERNFLSRRVSQKVTGIIDSCPNIGEEIEKFVQDCSIGADAWRRTGVLTFDGNTKVNNKVTYERIRQHLMKIYNRNFSYGTVVQLCIARNIRRLSAKRYKGVAKVISRRARKGFMLRYNPDAHWSSAFYRNLNAIQYTDGCHIVNINRDDASGFRLDTMATHRLHRTPMVQGSEAKTTYTDYVPKYKAVIQTSYNFSKTETTLELCAGVVKPVGVFLKNPTQHVQDLEMLEESVELRPAFINPLTNKRKLIECIRVDGAADEGPSHEEVQFIWTAHHIVKATQVTLVTARNSVSSYLNRVELQNGCLALAHANLFIPSTLGGSCMESGKVNKEKYKQNMELATEVYMNRVNGCPCGDTVIHLFKGADSSKQQQSRECVLQYLKGSKQRLKKENPAMYEYCEQVWNVRSNHIVANLPPQYIFSWSVAINHIAPTLCAHSKAVLLTFRDGMNLVLLYRIFLFLFQTLIVPMETMNVRSVKIFVIDIF